MKTQKRINENIIGPGKKYSTPVTLDPAYYEGAIIYAGDPGELYYSDGVEWKKPAIDIPDDIWYGYVDLEGDTLKSLRFRRKTTSETESFTGEDGQVTVDTTKNTLVVHDGTVGGSTLVSELGSQSLSNKTLSLQDTIITGIDGEGLILSGSELEIDNSVVLTISDNQTVTGVKTFDQEIRINDSGGIRTNQSSFNLIPQNATNVNFATAGTDISIGSGSGQTVVNNTLVVGNDLIVNGDTFTTSTDIITLDDKVLSLLDLSESDDPEPTDALADGGGIELNGTTIKEFKWYNADEAWTSSENINIPVDKSYLINGNEVLFANTLGLSITDSSLESVGVLSSGRWEADTISPDYGGTGNTTYIDGQLLIGNTVNNTLTKSRLAEGDGISILNGNGVIEISNADKGLDQNIFKNIADDVGNTQFFADNNNDTIRFEGTGTATVSFDNLTNTITIDTPAAVLIPGDGITVSSNTIAVDDTVVVLTSDVDQTILGTKSFENTVDTDITGNAGTATKLGTARKINNVDFDGTEDITVSAESTATPEDLTAGSGISATDGAGNDISGGIFNGSQSVTFDVDNTVVRTTGNQSIDGEKTFNSTINGNASTASALETAREINGVEFDGTENITVSSTTEEKLTAGDGISAKDVEDNDIAGSTFDGSQAVIFKNADKGSDQSIFKEIRDENDSVQISADGNSDFIKLIGGTNTTIDFDSENKSITLKFTGEQTANIATINDEETDSDIFPLFINSTNTVITEVNTSASGLTFNPATGTLGATNFNSLSDVRYKTNISKIENPLDIINKIEGVSFHWKNNGNPSIGFIAQEIEKVLPEIVHSDSAGRKLVSYGNITAVLLEAIKEQQKMIDKLMKLNNDKSNDS